LVLMIVLFGYALLGICAFIGHRLIVVRYDPRRELAMSRPSIAFLAVLLWPFAIVVGVMVSVFLWAVRVRVPRARVVTR
jgi:hypothetical protein